MVTRQLPATKRLHQRLPASKGRKIFSLHYSFGFLSFLLSLFLYQGGSSFSEINCETRFHVLLARSLPTVREAGPVGIWHIQLLLKEAASANREEGQGNGSWKVSDLDSFCLYLWALMVLSISSVWTCGVKYPKIHKWVSQIFDNILSYSVQYGSH